jgi:ADP-ribose pyrophosphatase YjhB (NUDIX family)
MSKRVRAVIVQDGKLLMIKRFKDDKTYFVFPGGGVIGSETATVALERECFEELNVSVKVGDLFFQQVFNDNEEFLYLCEIVGGQVGCGSGQEYVNMKSEDTYQPLWLVISDLPDMDIKPPTIVEKIINYSLLKI